MKTTASPKTIQTFQELYFFFSPPSPVWEVFVFFVAGFDAPILMENQTRLINDSGNFQFSRENIPNWACFLSFFFFKQRQQVHVWEGGSCLVRLRVSVGHFKEICFIAKRRNVFVQV